MIFNLTNGMLLLLVYGVGSIPFGFLLTKAVGLGDIRSIGSGNIGATNVLRTGRKGVAFLTLLLDLLKGWVVVFFARKYDLQTWAAMLVVLGHMFPVWLRFKGGKGVATYAGVLLGLSFPLGVQALLGWLAFLWIFGYSSLAALLAALLVPLTVWIWHYEGLLYVAVALSGLVWIRHYQNIYRLIKGQEPKVGRKIEQSSSSATGSPSMDSSTKASSKHKKQ